MLAPASNIDERRRLLDVATQWPLIAGLVLLAIPTILTLGEEHWSTEAGAHAPLVLVTGGWMIYRKLRETAVVPEPGSGTKVALLLIPSLLFYVFGRAYDYLILEALGLYGAVIAIAYRLAGGKLLRELSFPLFFLAFAIPIPGWVLDQATAPLKHFASSITTGVLQFAGVPIVREGVTLYVAQYQLLVEDACAGMNAIVGLTSLGLFYAYIMRGTSWRYCLLLMLFILPIAVLANVVRIIVLVLLTLYAGDQAAQGFLHGTAGLVLFGSALLLVMALDSVLWPLFRKRELARA